MSDTEYRAQQDTTGTAGIELQEQRDGYQPPPPSQAAVLNGFPQPQQMSYSGEPLTSHDSTVVSMNKAPQLSMPVSNKYQLLPACGCGGINIFDTQNKRIAFKHVPNGCWGGGIIRVLDNNNNIELGSIFPVPWDWDCSYDSTTENNCDNFDLKAQYAMLVNDADDSQATFQRRMSCCLGQRYQTDKSPFVRASNDEFHGFARTGIERYIQGKLVFEASAFAFLTTITTDKGSPVAKITRSYSFILHDSFHLDILVPDAPASHKLFLILVTLAISRSAGGILTPRLPRNLCPRCGCCTRCLGRCFDKCVEKCASCCDDC